MKTDNQGGIALRQQIRNHKKVEPIPNDLTSKGGDMAPSAPAEAGPAAFEADSGHLQLNLNAHRAFMRPCERSSQVGVCWAMARCDRDATLHSGLSLQGVWRFAQGGTRLTSAALPGRTCTSRVSAQGGGVALPKEPISRQIGGCHSAKP